MQKIFNKRSVFIFGAFMGVTGYLFSTATASIGIIIFLFTWLLNFRDISFKNVFRNNSINLLFVYFIILALGLLYSSNFYQGQKDVVKHLSFIILPIIFLTSKPFIEKERRQILRFYVVVISLFFLICLGVAIGRQLVFSSQGGIFNWYFFYRYDFLEVFRQHPTYLSMFTLLSICFIVFNKKSLFRDQIITNSFIVVQVVAILLYGSRIGLVILFLLFLFIAFNSLKSKPKRFRLKIIFGYILTLSIISILLWRIPIIKERILYTLGHEYDYRFNEPNLLKTGKNPVKEGRLLLWKDALDVIEKKPIFGYGTGATRDVLLKKYKEEGHALFFEQRYNAHNTYLELLLIGGIPLFFAFLALLSAILRRAIVTHDLSFYSFFIIISIVAFTETIFLSQGIIFFSFFYCFLSLKRRNKGILLIGPYPPPVGGISLFVKNLRNFLTEHFNECIYLINEFDNTSDNNIYCLSSNSKWKYFGRLIGYLLFKNNSEYLYYNGPHGYTRFLLVLVGKVLGYKTILHFHGKSVLNFHEENGITEKMSVFTLKHATHLIAVNRVLVEGIKKADSSLNIKNIPAYLPNTGEVVSEKVTTFIESLPNDRIYYLSYGSLDKDKSGGYNYGIIELLDFFNNPNVINEKATLIFVLILYKEAHFEEFREILAPLFKRNKERVKLFINNGNEPLVPFFNKSRAYIRWTHEDGFGISLLEAMNSGIRAIATRVCERPEGTILFDVNQPHELSGILDTLLDAQNPSTGVNYIKVYIEFFLSLGLDLKSTDNTIYK